MDGDFKVWKCLWMHVWDNCSWMCIGEKWWIWASCGVKQLNGVCDFVIVCNISEVEASPFWEADGMLCSILGGSQACKWLDVVLLLQRGKHAQEMKSVWKWRKMNDKGESGLIRKGVSPLLPFLLLHLLLSSWVIVACLCFWLCREAHLFLFLSVSPLRMLS